jgi:two-component system LytT family sensor kinase
LLGEGYVQGAMPPTSSSEQKQAGRILWTYHAAWWLFIWVIEILRHVGPISTQGRVYLEITVLYLLGSLVALLLHLLFRRVNHRSLPMFGLVGVVIAVSIVGAYIWAALQDVLGTAILRVLLHTYRAPASSDLLGFPFFYAVLFITYSGFYFTLRIWIDWLEQRDRTERALYLAQSARLQMLRYQLNPHFLFNALSSLRALVNSEQAEAMVTRLSEFLRYTLVEKGREVVPLSSEVEVTEHYLAIEQIRFGKDLIVEYHLDPEAVDYPVPRFILNPLVENAVKHGRSKGERPVRVEITTTLLPEDTLEIEVVNSGSLRAGADEKGDPGTQTGLDNVRDRLEHHYPGRSSLDLFESGGQVHARIRLGRPAEAALG